MNNALKKSVDEILNLALNEDQTKSDLTSHLTLKNKKIKTNIIFKEDGILSGTEIISYLLKKFNKAISIKENYAEPFANLGKLYKDIFIKFLLKNKKCFLI